MKGQHVRTVISPSRVGGRHNLEGEKKGKLILCELVMMMQTYTKKNVFL